MRFMHGGDIYSYMESNGGKLPIDLSSSINPYGTPEAVQKAMREALEQCGSYPDPICLKAREAISKSENVPSDWIYCGAGAAEVIYRLVSVIKPEKALLPVPCFAEYERALNGCEISFYVLKESENFNITESFLDSISGKTDMVFLCNPNNPTGITVPPGLLSEIDRRCAENGTWLVLDECFLDFLRDAEDRTLKPRLKANPYLVILRSYTKMYAVPGIRFGWCMSSNGRLIEGLHGCGQPWNVSVIAQRSAEAASKEREFAKFSAEKLSEERGKLRDGLKALGMKVYPGEANFLLFRSSDLCLREKLLNKGILIRDCSNFRGLTGGYYRTAVKTEKETEALLTALDEIKLESKHN